jgi:hypothetical protein
VTSTTHFNAEKSSLQAGLVDRLRGIGANPKLMPSAEFNAFIRSEVVAAEIKPQ